MLLLLRKLFAGLRLLSASIQSDDPSRRTNNRTQQGCFSSENCIKSDVKLKYSVFCVLPFVVGALFVTSDINFLAILEERNRISISNC